MSEKRWYYQHQLDHGELTLYLPEKLNAADCDDVEEHFKLVLRQARRRAAKPNQPGENPEPDQ